MRATLPVLIEAVKRLQAGEIGRVLFARGWYNNARPSIGHGKPAPVPEYWLACHTADGTVGSWATPT